MRWRMTASRLSSATVARRMPRRCATRMPQAFSHDHFLLWVSIDCAAWFCRKFGRPIRLVYVCRQRFRRRACDDRVQGQSLRTGRDPMGGPLVCGVPDQLPPARGNDGRARRRGGPRHAQSLGAQVCSSVGSGVSSAQAPVGPSWRMDETYVRVKGAWKYLYRAVDKAGTTVEFLLTAKRDRKAALRFLRKAIKWNGTPEKITIDKSGANTAAIESHNAETEAGIEIRQIKYLNNIIEQDHRAIKRLVRPILGFKTFRSAPLTPAGAELMHRV